MIAPNRSLHPAIQGNRQLARMRRTSVLLFFVTTSFLVAQDVIMSTPQDQPVPPILRDKSLPPVLSQLPAPPETPFKIGPVSLHPQLNYSYLKAEGLPTTQGRRVASEITRFAPGLTVDFGQHLTLAYNPTWVSYTARAMQDSVDQSLKLSGAAKFHDWGYQFSQDYVASSPTLVETGQQTRQKTWRTMLSATYNLSQVVQLQASGNEDERYTDIAPDTRTWTGKTALNLTFSPRLSLNLGLSYFYTEIAHTPDNFGDTYNLSLNWKPLNKLTLAINAGRQSNHSTSSNGLDISSPLLNFDLGYQPFEATSLTLSAARTVSPSYFKGQITEGTQRNISLNQRILGRFFLSASYGHQDTDYITTEALTADERKDAVKTYNARISTKLFKRLSLSALYTKSQIKSTLAQYSFSTKQYGVELKFSY